MATRFVAVSILALAIAMLPAGPIASDVMHTDNAEFAATGGWGFDEFGGDTRARVIGETARMACFQCHTQRKTQDFVFTALRR
jgi:hypothetical protein